MDRSDFIEHRRPDGELVGWLRPEGEGFVPVDLLGREHGGAVDWLDGETLLEDLGIRYLADPYVLRLENGTELRVRITEVSTRGIVVKKDDFGAIDAPLVRYELAWPMPPELTPLGDRELPAAW
ncbi:hypothetical protein ACFOE1_04760 [Agromyces mediolanus]|uniref:Uncharacterized protein n=1 Tax=Agromyces mediolanus TaxID=41986 RepID=A0A918CLV8_AGRME|nr:hypothetical protein [Agromyces mediolanus]GGR29502.1 hypothetical protein GCM10010196_24310 [Agromyces mediolanus]GLJ72227.1 hypothetical protein GCM10017583_14830 [Agromyces mediolanus]